jgi:hypothetical protein
MLKGKKKKTDDYLSQLVLQLYVMDFAHELQSGTKLRQVIRDGKSRRVIMVAVVRSKVRNGAHRITSPPPMAKMSLSRKCSMRNNLRRLLNCCKLAVSITFFAESFVRMTLSNP